MARRRMLSEDILTDEKFNGLSLEAQNLFLRMLAKADDCGVVPGNEYTLAALTNPPVRVRKNLLEYVSEIVGAGLGRMIEYQGKPFFTFKPDSFLEHQGHILNKRTRSEYLRIAADEYDSGNFLEVPGNSCSKEENASSAVESRKQKVESSKQKEESRKNEKEEKLPFGEFNNVLLTLTEHQRLIHRLQSEDRAAEAIEILSSFKHSKGKKYVSDYATFTSWVIGALEEREAARARQRASNNPGGRERRPITVEELRKSIVPSEAAG